MGQKAVQKVDQKKRKNRKTDNNIYNCEQAIEGSQKLVSNKKPSQFIGLIRSKFQTQKNCAFGTGIIIAPTLILTVAHNICHPKNKSSKFAKWVQFYPFVNGLKSGLKTNTPFVQNSKQGKTEGEDQQMYRIQKWCVPQLYSQQHIKQYDFCLLQLDRPIQMRKQVKLLSNFQNKSISYRIEGYPIEGYIQTGTEQLRLRQFGANGGIQTLYSGRGVLQHKISTQKGQSGSPIFITLTQTSQTIYCVGIHKGGEKKTNTNEGVYFTTQNINLLQQMENNQFGTQHISNLLVDTPPAKDELIQFYNKNVDFQSVETQEKRLNENAVGGKISREEIYGYLRCAKQALEELIYNKAVVNFDKFIVNMKAIEMDQTDEQELQSAMVSLAISYSQSQNYDKSISVYDQFVNLYSDRYPSDSVRMALIMNNKGVVLANQKLYAQASILLKKAYQIRLSKLGPKHPETYSSLQNLIGMLLKQGNQKERWISDYEKVLAFKERRYGKESSGAIWTKMNIAMAYFQLKNYKNCLVNFKQCCQLLKNGKKTQDKSKQFIKIQKNCQEEIRSMLNDKCQKQELILAAKVAESYELIQLARKIKDDLSKFDT